MSKKLVVINIGGREFLGEEPLQFPPSPDETFMFRECVMVDHQTVGTPQGPARIVVMHPVGEYRVKSYLGWRPPTENERQIYLAEMEARRTVRSPNATPEMLEEFRKKMTPEQFENFIRRQAGQLPAGGGIVAP